MISEVKIFGIRGLFTINNIFSIFFGQICPINIVYLRSNSVPRIVEFDEDVHFFCFGSKILIFGKFGPENQNCMFKIELGIYTNSSMQNSIVIFMFSLLDRKYPFWVNLLIKKSKLFA